MKYWLIFTILISLIILVNGWNLVLAKRGDDFYRLYLSEKRKLKQNNQAKINFFLALKDDDGQPVWMIVFSVIFFFFLIGRYFLRN